MMKPSRQKTNRLVCLGLGLVVIGALVAGCAALTGPDEADGDAGMVLVGAGALDGPATRGDWSAATAEPNVYCGLEDVQYGDIDDVRQDSVPSDGWSQPRVPENNRCGDDFETLLFRLTNCERQARSLPPLECDERLVWAGRAHSRDMRDRDYFSHVTPEGKAAGERLTDYGVDWRMSAENIALAPTMALAHTSWMESRGHRENILRPDAEYLGIGVVKGERGYVMTALFVGSSL